MYLEEVLPSISKDLKKSTPGDIYSSVHVFLDYTFKNIIEHNLSAVKKCFALADKLYSKGDRAVKCALENVFVFSFSNIPVKNNNDKKVILGMIPGTLYSLYMKQVMHPGA
jgi:hypothetical protein